MTLSKTQTPQPILKRKSVSTVTNSVQAKHTIMILKTSPSEFVYSFGTFKSTFWYF